MEHTNNIESLLVNGIESIGLTLPGNAIKKFTVYFQELSRWNKKVNLTSLSKEEDIVVNLFIDSLAISLAFDLRKERSILDIGSGGGFPGIPIKIAFPQINLTLVEPKIKKTAFLHHIVGVLSLDQVVVEALTIQEFVQNKRRGRSYDLAMSKAIKPEDIFPAARSVLHHESRACLYRSSSLGRASSYFDMELEREESYELPYGHGSRVLSILKPSIQH